jgi:hypothetical protein
MSQFLKIFAFFVLILASLAPVHAKSAKSDSPSGVVSFQNSSINFGAIKRGEKLTAKFPYKNIGQGQLVIQGVQAPCDCTTVDASKGKSIPPGEGGVIEVLFDSTDYSGKVVKAITVVTNERAMPDRTLTISALINSEIEADPPLVDFGDVNVSQAPSQTIKLKNLMSTDLKIEDLRYNQDYLDIVHSKSGKDWVIEVKLKPSAPIGFLKDTIYVKNNSTALPDMPIPVRGTVKGQISANINYIEFGSIASNEKSNREVILSSSELFDISANRIELMINGEKKTDLEKNIKIGVSPANKNGKKITLDLSNPGTTRGSVHGKVFLDTTNPQQKTIVLDFYAFFR